MLAIALQIWDGDAAIAIELVKLIASIEKTRRKDIEFILSARRGTSREKIEEIMSAAASTFMPRFAIIGRRFGSGWPNGCNELWSETMQRISGMKRDGIIKSTGVLTFESDCIPLRQDWLDCLSSAWSNDEKAGFECVGHKHGDPATHINGNAIFNVDMLDRYPQMNGASATAGWDAYHGNLLLEIGSDTSLIYQQYRIKQIDREGVEAIRKDGVIPALFHGIKNMHGINAVNAMIADGSFFTRDASAHVGQANDAPRKAAKSGGETQSIPNFE